MLSVFLCLLNALAIPHQATTPTLLNSEQMSNFVRAQGTQLVLNNKPFYYGGTNSYLLFYATRPEIDTFFENAVKTKASVVRTWLFCDGQVECNAQSNDGQRVWFMDIVNGQVVVNEDSQTGLGRFDYVIESAKRHGIKLMVTLSNNWGDFGGIDVYVDRLGSAQKYHSEFFTSESIKNAFKSYVEKVLNRVNTFTGVQYKNDPTIMGMELMNESRCVGSNKNNRFPSDPNCTPEQLTRWIDEMSTFIKKMDPNHLIAIGDEGFWNKGPSYPNTYSNVWDGSSGTDFVRNAELPNIDLLGIHLYFDHWGAKEMPVFMDNSKRYVEEHVQVARKVNKPFYVGEYGYVYRDQQAVINTQLQQLMENNGVVGTNLWYMVTRDYSAVVNDPYWYYPWDKNIDRIVLNHAQRMLFK
jgi:mannan endo-1,4-beta-mannosidase